MEDLIIDHGSGISLIDSQTARFETGSTDSSGNPISVNYNFASDVCYLRDSDKVLVTDDSAQAAGTATFTALGTAPTANIPIVLTVVG